MVRRRVMGQGQEYSVDRHTTENAKKGREGGRDKKRNRRTWTREEKKEVGDSKKIRGKRAKGHTRGDERRRRGKTQEGKPQGGSTDRRRRLSIERISTIVNACVGEEASSKMKAVKESKARRVEGKRVRGEGTTTRNNLAEKSHGKGRGAQCERRKSICAVCHIRCQWSG